jgi:uncharacterized membrane protein
MLGGQTLLYDVQCVDRILGTAVSLPTRPATIVMRISEDGEEAWFQVTRLTHDTGKAVTWVSNFGGQDVVIHKSITEGHRAVVERAGDADGDHEPSAALLLRN